MRKKRRLYMRENFLIRFLCPKLLILNLNKKEGLFECGVYLSNIDTGISFCIYDFGREFKLSILGFGLYIWWLP